MKAKHASVLCATLLASGCNGWATGASDSVQRDNATHPAGRFVSAGKREYSNGTEIYVLDTTTGMICYSLISNDGKPDSRFCGETIVGPSP